MPNPTATASGDRIDMAQVRAEVKEALDLGLPHALENLLAIIVHLAARIDELEMRADEGGVPTARELAELRNCMRTPACSPRRDLYEVYASSGYSLVHLIPGLAQ